jgi:putative FmdB family regulatory protein
MPTYEYACQSCGTHVEVVQRFHDAPLTECGVCGGPLRKVFHPAGILFKGSGFYVTDSRSSSKSASSGSGSGSGEGSKGSDAATGTTGGTTSSGGDSKVSTVSKDAKGSAGSKAPKEKSA